MAFVGKQLSDLPAKTGPGRKHDEEKAALLFTITSVPGQAAFDDDVFADTKKARAAANAAKRLLRHKVAESIDIGTRVFTVEGGYGYSIWQEIPTPETAKATKAK